jgi:branched-chain amino acid transport system substrate-binding protein
MSPSRRTLISTAVAALALSALATLPAQAQGLPKLKVGLMLPYTGTYAALGNAIENGFRLHVAEQGGKLGGREIEFVKVDDESDPSKATDNVNKLIKRDNVDVLVGSVHSGVAMAMAKVAKDTGTVLIVPNAGADAVTGAMCAPNIFRSSFSNWQPGYAMGEVVAKKGHKKVVTITWKYAAGDESVKGFKESFEKGGGTVVKELNLPFPNVEFQALLTEIAAAKPDAVFTFFAGGGAVKFVKDYAAAGLKKTIPLYGSGFLTDGTLDAQGADANGLFTALHYADSLNTPRDNAFRLAYAKTYKLQPDVYAVQGYDAAQMLGIGMAAVKGDISKKAEFTAAVEKAKIDSPRGAFTLSKAHNPVQDFYLRQVGQGEQTGQHRQQGAGRPGARLQNVVAHPPACPLRVAAFPLAGGNACGPAKPVPRRSWSFASGKGIA